VYPSSLKRKEREVAELLGVPDDVTQIAMIPVGHTIGTDFPPAPRPPSTDVAYVDHWGAHQTGERANTRWDGAGETTGS
jgi:hypothetical protein